MKGCKLKYILKAIKYQKKKVLANILLLLLVKGGFLKSASRVHLNFDHAFNFPFRKQPENTVTPEVTPRYLGVMNLCGCLNNCDKLT